MLNILATVIRLSKEIKHPSQTFLTVSLEINSSAKASESNCSCSEDASVLLLHLEHSEINTIQPLQMIKK